MEWNHEELSYKSPFKYQFYADPSDIILRVRPFAFFYAVKKTLSSVDFFNHVAVFLQGDLIATGNVNEALCDAIRKQSRIDGHFQEPNEVSKCPCYVIWHYYTSLNPRYETVFHRAEADILNFLGVRHVHRIHERSSESFHSQNP